MQHLFRSLAWDSASETFQHTGPVWDLAPETFRHIGLAWVDASERFQNPRPARAPASETLQNLHPARDAVSERFQDMELMRDYASEMFQRIVPMRDDASETFQHLHPARGHVFRKRSTSQSPPFMISSAWAKPPSRGSTMSAPASRRTLGDRGPVFTAMVYMPAAWAAPTPATVLSPLAVDFPLFGDKNSLQNACLLLVIGVGNHTLISLSS